MKIFGYNLLKDNAPSIKQEEGGSFVGKYPIDEDSYDGEKTDGDLGAPVQYALDYDAMSARAWQSFIDSDLVSIVLDRYLEWIIGTGLTLQAVPDLKVIKSEGVNISQEAVDDFTSVAESRFRLLANSRLSDYRQLANLHKISIEAIKNAFLSGDCLVIYRIDDNGLVNVDYVNGDDIKTPIGVEVKDGNRIIQGVKMDSAGRHVAYWVQTSSFEYERIAARDSLGRLRAELIMWKNAKRSDVRGLSGLHMSFQKMKNIDRYTEASIQGAVTRANLAYFITTEKDAITAGPILGRANTAKVNAGNDVNLDEVKRKVYADTAKTIHELGPGQDIKMPESRNESNVQDFIPTYFNHFCAAIGIPPEVALQLYTNSFSASRMATKSWEHTLKVKREYLSIYKNVYRLFIDVQVSSKKIDQPQLKNAIYKNNEFLILAFTKCTLIGANVPHADPVKEAKAHRLLVGNDDIPLENAGHATESLGTGDYDEIIEIRKREINKEGDMFTQAKESNNISENE